jgi:hypothetical protein
MRDSNFVRVPLAVMTAGLVVGAICQRLPRATPLYVAAGLIWFGMLVYVCTALLKPQWFAR